jgi:DNA-directed RNA polymerase specialized sigma24 family protein
MNGDAVPALGDLVARHRPRVEAFVRFEAGGLLRFETEEDLVQGIVLRALERGASFEWRGEPSFLAWLRKTGESFLADRRSHWGALKRRSGRVYRFAMGGDTQDPGVVGEPAATGTGPSTFASRRELLALTTRALDLLLPRDRDLVRWSAEDVSLEEQAARLGVGYEAAGKARQRALERFRKTFALVSGGAPGADS